MSASVPTQPVKETVEKINDELAVGEDLEFQYRWWRFEKAVWISFTLIIVAAILGVFGRGPLAKSSFQTPDGAMNIKYERVERFATPSLLRIEFGPGAIHEGKVQLWVSEGLITTLGNQRVIPQPSSSTLGQGGIFYTFPVTTNPATAQFELTPARPGAYNLKLRIPGSQEVSLRIFVVP